jgi:3',5'-nucleoside bisphosphate phosphatase
MRIDLHAHTTASDGVLTPTELVALAAERHVDVIAVTDHDTVAGVAEATEAGRPVGVRVVAGIELSARREDRAVHMLGYFLDPDNGALLRRLDEMQTERLDRVHRMVRRLNELGYELTVDDVLAQARGAVVARPHVARALVARGHIGSVSDAFTPELIADGGRADVPRTQLTPHDAVALIGSAGGVAVIAHPGLSHHLGTHEPLPESLVRALRDEGLAGLEVDHPDHPPLVRDELRALAVELDLVATGGSDFHGETGRPIGDCTTSDDAFAHLEALAAAARSDHARPGTSS